MTLDTGFSAARIDQHVATVTRPAAEPARHTAGLINWRPAEPWELEVQQRAWQRQRERDAELVRIPPRSDS